MREEYVGLEGDKGSVWSGKCKTEPAREVDFKSKKLVVVQAYIEGDIERPFVIVPGYKDGDAYTKEGGGRRAAMVETVPAEEKKEIEELLKPITKGPINFW